MKLTGNITRPFWIHVKGILFVIIGVLAGILLVKQTMEWDTVFFYLIGIWAFCRFYYYLFYVFERYLGGGPYSGIFDQLKHIILKRR